MKLIWAAVRESFLLREVLGISFVGGSRMKLIVEFRLTDWVVPTLKIMCVAKLQHYKIFSNTMLKIEKITSQMQNKIENARAVRKRMESC